MCATNFSFVVDQKKISTSPGKITVLKKVIVPFAQTSDERVNPEMNVSANRIGHAADTFSQIKVFHRLCKLQKHPL